MISQSHRFLFVHIPKTAGTTLREALDAVREAGVSIVEPDKAPFVEAAYVLNRGFGFEDWHA